MNSFFDHDCLFAFLDHDCFFSATHISIAYISIPVFSVAHIAVEHISVPVFVTHMSVPVFSMPFSESDVRCMAYDIVYCD